MDVASPFAAPKSWFQHAPQSTGTDASTGVYQMRRDIISGNFKGFAMLRQMTLAQPDKMLPGWEAQHKPQPVYVEVRAGSTVSRNMRSRSWVLRSPHDLHSLRVGVILQGYGFVPPSQVRFLAGSSVGLSVRQKGRGPAPERWGPAWKRLVVDSTKTHFNAAAVHRVRFRHDSSFPSARYIPWPAPLIQGDGGEKNSSSSLSTLLIHCSTSIWKIPRQHCPTPSTRQL